MVYETFLTFIKDQLQQMIGDQAHVTLRKIPKNNGIILDALCIHTDDTLTSPAIYLNPYYEQYTLGMSTEEIIHDILNLYYSAALPDSITGASFANPDLVRSKIMFKLIHAASNQTLLNKIPHIPYLDLAVIFYLHLDHSPDGHLTAVIHNDHMKLWHMNTKDLWKLALFNTPTVFPAQITNMSDMIKDMAQNKLGDEYDEEMIDTILFSEDDAFPLYVLSNITGLNGAGCMLYKDQLKDFAESIGSDLIILPSSIHEVLITPYTPETSFEYLSEMVASINQNEVPAEDQLSNQVYLYTRMNDRICIASHNKNLVGTTVSTTSSRPV